MAAYYVASVILVAVPITALTAMVIHAPNKQGDVSASFNMSRVDSR
jgi:hypothetical protein